MYLFIILKQKSPQFEGFFGTIRINNYYLETSEAVVPSGAVAGGGVIRAVATCSKCSF